MNKYLIIPLNEVDENPVIFYNLKELQSKGTIVDADFDGLTNDKNERHIYTVGFLEGIKEVVRRKDIIIELKMIEFVEWINKEGFEIQKDLDNQWWELTKTEKAYTTQELLKLFNEQKK